MLLYVKNLHLRIGACLPCSGTQASRRKLLLSPCRADVGSAKTRRVHRPAEAGFSFVEPRPKRATDIKKGACAAAEFCGAQAPFLRFWPCRVGEGAFPRRVGFTASAAGCVGHRSPSVSHLRYSRLEASLRSRPFAAANGRLRSDASKRLYRKCETLGERCPTHPAAEAVKPTRRGKAPSPTRQGQKRKKGACAPQNSAAAQAPFFISVARFGRGSTNENPASAGRCTLRVFALPTSARQGDKSSLRREACVPEHGRHAPIRKCRFLT